MRVPVCPCLHLLSERGCLTGVDRSREEAAQLLDGKYCLTGRACAGLCVCKCQGRN